MSATASKTGIIIWQHDDAIETCGSFFPGKFTLEDAIEEALVCCGISMHAHLTKPRGFF
jgi:hypothetical protein